MEAPMEQNAVVPQQESDIEKLIQQSQEEEDRAALWKQSAKVRDAIMGAGSGKILKTDTSMYEELANKAQRPIKNLLLKQELEDKQTKNDPNSNISKLVRKSLQDLGMSMEGLEGVSYSQLEKLYPSLTQGLYTKIAADARKEEAQINRLNKAEAASDRKELQDFNRYQKVGTGIDRMKTQMEKSDIYKSYINAKDAQIGIDQALSSSDPNIKIEKAAAFMKYAKSAQGDSSVVRSEDMRVLAGSLGFNNPKEMLAKLSAKAEGSQFTPGELQAMRKVISTIMEVKKGQIDRDYLQPIQRRAQANDYDLSESLSPDFVREVQERELTTEEKLKEFDKKLKTNQSRIEELKKKKEM
jgi:hypothetical protein